MDQLTEQSIFDTVYRHLLTQRKKSQVGVGTGLHTCVYRSPSGLKCAIGCLFTDEEYKPDMEANTNFGGDVDALIEHNMLPERLIPFSYFLLELQDIHDKVDVCNWAARLADLASDHNLTIPSM